MQFVEVESLVVEWNLLWSNDYVNTVRLLFQQ